MNRKKEIVREHKINQEITFQEIRLVGEDVENKVISTKEALILADKSDMDLVLINEKSNPPICKLMKYEKYVYQKNKQKQPKAISLKEIRLSLNISENDLKTKTTQINEFLTKGHKVKICLMLKGREMAFKDKAFDMLKKLPESLKGAVETPVKLEGKKLFLNMKPSK